MIGRGQHYDLRRNSYCTLESGLHVSIPHREGTTVSRIMSKCSLGNCLTCQSLIGKVQQQHLRHLLLPLSLNLIIFAMFFQKSRSISFFQSLVFAHFKPFLENRSLGAEIDRLFILSCPPIFSVTLVSSWHQKNSKKTTRPRLYKCSKKSSSENTFSLAFCSLLAYNLT